MAEFLTTKGIAAKLEDIIKNAEKELYIVTPYLKLSDSFYDRLQDATSVVTHLVYGKSELTHRETDLLNNLNINIYYKDNLHGKCYMNEEYALITSMNLHSYSEANNREFGVLINRKTDRIAYQDCTKEIKSVVSRAKVLKSITQNHVGDEKKVNEANPGNDLTFSWFQYLQKHYPSNRFIYDGNSEIVCEHFPNASFNFSNKYGFVSLAINKSYNECKDLKHHHYDRLDSLLRDYRLYWSTPDNINLYHAKHRDFPSLESEIDYCARGLEILIREVDKF